MSDAAGAVESWLALPTPRLVMVTCGWAPPPVAHRHALPHLIRHLGMGSDIFATLRPTGTAARVAFSKTVELSRSQPTPPWLHFMHVDPVPVYDQEYTRQCEQSGVTYELDSEASVTEPKKDTKEHQQDTYKL